MLTLQTITTVSPIRTEADSDRAQQRLDELLRANAWESPDEHVRNEFEVLMALIYFYEQHAIPPQTWSLAGADTIGLLEEALFQKQLSIVEAARRLDVSTAELEQVLSRQQPISFVLAKRLHQRLGISAEALLTAPE